MWTFQNNRNVSIWVLSRISEHVTDFVKSLFLILEPPHCSNESRNYKTNFGNMILLKSEPQVHACWGFEVFGKSKSCLTTAISIWNVCPLSLEVLSLCKTFKNETPDPPRSRTVFQVIWQALREMRDHGSQRSLIVVWGRALDMIGKVRTSRAQNVGESLCEEFELRLHFCYVARAICFFWLASTKRRDYNGAVVAFAY